MSLAIALGALTLLFLLATLTISRFAAYAGVRSLMETRERLSRDSRQHMTELASSIAHEINQPLAAIGAYADAGQRWLAGERPNMSEATEALRKIGQEANRAGQVIGRIRAFLRGSETRRSPVNMREVVPDVIAEIADKARQNAVTVREVGTADLPPVDGDAGQLHQVVLNLVDNAIDAMTDATGRERLLEIECRVEHRDTLAISVRDSGKGIVAEDKDRVFDAFHTTKPGAHGMGLAISRSIVEGHGGRLWLTPNEGYGVTAHMTFQALRSARKPVSPLDTKEIESLRREVQAAVELFKSRAPASPTQAVVSPAQPKAEDKWLCSPRGRKRLEGTLKGE
jgi:signal transduction histidine kinase